MFAPASIEARYVPSIILNPRPHSSKKAFLLLVPLLDTPRQVNLPNETWYQILNITMSLSKETESSMNTESRRGFEIYKRDLLLVCKGFKALAAPLLYARPYLPRLSAFNTFGFHLLASDQKWDGLRRIPFSTPGRWVLHLDLSRVAPSTPAERLSLDALLSNLFPVIPFASHIWFNDTVTLSRRALTSFTEACGGLGHLRSLKGLRAAAPYPNFGTSSLYEDDHLTKLVAGCGSLEELGVIGAGGRSDTDDHDLVMDSSNPLPQLHLPHLRKLALLDMPDSVLLRSLAASDLPVLRSLDFTIYDARFPSTEPSPTAAFLSHHGPALSSLFLHPSQLWPDDPAPPPTTILTLVPNIRYLGLSAPLPQLSNTPKPHPLQRLSIPRPTMEFLSSLAKLPHLREVQLREVKHLRKGLPRGAAGAGSYAVIREWQRRLGRRIRILDSLGIEAT